MSRSEENTGFTCQNCGQQVLPLSDGSYRNHCPFCLFSKHIDVSPGDRGNKCGGLMEPKRLTYRSGKGFQILHKCLKCGEEKVNRVAGGQVQPDDIDELTRLL